MSDLDRPDATEFSSLETDSDLPEQLEAVLAQLPVDKIAYVIARSNCQTNKEAALQVGTTESAVKNWPKEQKALIEQALRLMAQDGMVTALHLRRRNLARAMSVKVGGLESKDEKIKQSVATEIIEWELGGKVMKIAPTDPSGEHEYTGVQDDLQRRLAGLAAALGAAGVHKQSDGAGT